MEGLKYFFAFIDAVPSRFATPALSIRHLEVIAVFIAMYTVLTLIFKNKDRNVRSRFLLTVSLLLLFFNLLNELWLIIIGHFTLISELPLQLCGTMYIIIPLMVVSRNRFLMEFVYACGMPGAFFAMLTPNIQGYYFISWGFLMFMLIHSLIVFVPLFMLLTGEFTPQISNLSKVAGMFLSLVILDFMVDRQLGSNYLYLSWAPEGTLLDTFASWVGTPGYIFIALIVVAIAWLLLYLPWEYQRTHQRQVLTTE